MQIAYGLSGDWSKIAVIDSEYGSASLYSHLGEYSVLGVTAPFSPEKFVEAIHICETAGIEVIILDSISHEWDGTGGILDIHNAMAGNSFTNWGKVTPRHNAFVQSILQSPCHILATIRSKQDYVLTEKNGRTVPEKVGLKGVQRDGLEYDFTILFELDIKHYASASKDRTSLFSGKPEFLLGSEIGRRLTDWCTLGTVSNKDEIMLAKIDTVSSIGELLELFKNSPLHQISLHESFTRKRQQLEINLIANQILYPNQNGNGKYNVSESGLPQG